MKEMNDIVVVVMIEKKGAMENLEEILSVKGVDMVQFGSSDYSISIGKPGKIKSPETQKAHLDMIKLALKKGIAPRVETTNMEDAKAFIEMGVRHFCVEQDLGIISQWCKQQERTGIKSLLASL